MQTIPPSEMNSSPPQPPAQASGSGWLANLGWAALLILGMLLSLAVGFVKAISMYGARPTDPHGWGYVFGATLGPLILASLGVGIYYTLRKSRRTRRRVATSIVLWALVVAFLARPPSKAPRMPGSKEGLGQLMAQAYKEASGAVPPDQLSRDELVVIMREMYRNVIQFNQEYDKEAALLQTAEMGDLLEAPSFRDRNTIEETLRQLRAMASMEEKHASLEHVFAKTMARVQQQDWPEGFKREFLMGMRQPLEAVNQRRQTVFRAGLQWIHASSDLYEFAHQNLPGISVRGQDIIIRDSKTREAFNQKMNQAEELRQKFLAANEEFERQNKASIGEYGLTPADLGKTE